MTDGGQQKMETQFYTCKEMAELLGISYVNLTKWIKDPECGTPPHLIVGKNTIKFPKDRYEEWMRGQADEVNS